MISPKDAQTLPLDILLKRIKEEEHSLELLKKIYELRSKLEKDKE